MDNVENKELPNLYYLNKESEGVKKDVWPGKGLEYVV
jgi:hypothetical protein